MTSTKGPARPADVAPAVPTITRVWLGGLTLRTQWPDEGLILGGIGRRT
ncbi:hypothetical protein [Nocardia sp. NPDC057455]